MVPMKSFAARSRDRRHPPTVSGRRCWTSPPGRRWDPSLDRVEGTIASRRPRHHPRRGQLPRRSGCGSSSSSRPAGWCCAAGCRWGCSAAPGATRSTPAGDGRTGFSMEESYAGPLAPAITRSIPDLQPSFEAFAAAGCGRPRRPGPMIDHVEGSRHRRGPVDPDHPARQLGVRRLARRGEGRPRDPGRLDHAQLPVAVHRGPARDAARARRLDAARQRRRAEGGQAGTVEAWAGPTDNPVGGWYGLRKGYRGRFGDVRAAGAGAPRAGRARAPAAQQPDARQGA